MRSMNDSATESDRFNLRRFLDAQAAVYSTVMAELQAGLKRTHWMWFIFPQHASLGRSETARHFGIGSKDEAAAYWRHPALGARLRECCEALLKVQGRSAHDIFGSPDDLKLRSSITLFAEVAPEEAIFGRVLDRYFGGRPDERTLGLL